MMKLEQYRTLWGVLDLTDGEAARSPVHTFDEAIAELANEGYDGVELPLKLANTIIPIYSLQASVFLVEFLGIIGNQLEGMSTYHVMF